MVGIDKPDRNKLEVLRNNDIPSDAWESLLYRNSYASPFQTSNFHKFCNSVPNLSSEAIALCYDGSLTGLAVITIQKERGIKGFFSRRAIMYGGPLLDPRFPDEAILLIQHINRSIPGEQIYIESRNSGDYSKYREAFTTNGWDYRPHLNFMIDLQGKSLEQLLKGMSYNRRREIRNSNINKAESAECKSESDLFDLYQILIDLYKRLGLPLPSLDFFRKFNEYGIGKVFVVKHKEKVIGGSICPVLEEKSIHSWFYCGIKDYVKGVYPTHLAIVAALEYGLRNNLKTFDFMGAGRPEVEYGVRQYKKEFGGVSVEYGRFLKINKPLLYEIGRAGISLLKKFKY
jgi:serine/alanine adding enzyme